MNNNQPHKNNKQSRRNFVKNSSLLMGATMVSPLFANAGYFSSVDDTIKVALVGCGGRGTGACVQALSTKENVQLVAMADIFKDQLDTSLQNMADALKDKKDRLQVKEEHKFVGFDAYKKAIPLADVVILATPPGFRPIQFEEAVNQGKHIFMEKPVATGPAGIRRILAAAEKAKANKQNVVVGLQRHYQNSYKELIQRIHDGMIGDIVSAQAWWNSAGVWVHPRKPEWNEMEYQMRNWYYFTWICGDHIVEQHVHNIDVVNWAIGDYPIKAQGMGGRLVRRGPEHGQIFDHHYVEFHYQDGAILNSQCRHMPKSMTKVDELVEGTKGRVFFNEGRMEDRKGNTIYQFDMKNQNQPYQTEHDELFAAIAKGEFKFWDAEHAAKTTMTAILGRMATYSGQELELDKVMELDLGYLKDEYSFDMAPPVVPDKIGNYPVPKPGTTKYV